MPTSTTDLPLQTLYYRVCSELPLTVPDSLFVTHVWPWRSLYAYTCINVGLIMDQQKICSVLRLLSATSLESVMPHHTDKRHTCPRQWRHHQGTILFPSAHSQCLNQSIGLIQTLINQAPNVISTVFQYSHRKSVTTSCIIILNLTPSNHCILVEVSSQDHNVKLTI